MTIQNAYRGSLTNARGGEIFKTEVGGLALHAGGIELLVDLMSLTLDPGRAIATLRGKKYSARAKILKDLAIAHELSGLAKQLFARRGRPRRRSHAGAQHYCSWTGRVRLREGPRRRRADGRRRSQPKGDQRINYPINQR